MAEKKLGFRIYQLSWSRYNSKGECMVFYTDWTVDKKHVKSQQMELLNLARVDKGVSVGDIIEEFVVCTRDELVGLTDKVFPLKED